MSELSNKEHIVNSEYFNQIEEAIDYNQSSSMGWAKRQLKLILNAFLNGKIVIIEDIGIELKTLEEYKEWKNDREKLNIFNSELLINEIKLSNSRNQQW